MYNLNVLVIVCVFVAKSVVSDNYVVMPGPLLYHFADMPNEPSIELGYAELRKVILSLNFEIVVSESSPSVVSTVVSLIVDF